MTRSFRFLACQATRAHTSFPSRRSPFRRIAAPSVRAYATASSTSTSATRPAAHVKVVEVGARDGLQNEKAVIPFDVKQRLLQSLAQTGLTAIEGGAFVSPKWVPQMAGSDQILADILHDEQKKYYRNRPTTDESHHPITYSFLVPNAQGLQKYLGVLDQQGTTTAAFQPFSDEPALEHTTSAKPILEAAVLAAATESFSRKNLNCDIATSLANCTTVIQDAKARGLRVRAYISVVLGCPFEGPNTDPRRVSDIALSLLEAGADEISLGDTTGMGTAPRTRELLSCLKAASIRVEDLALHFHDTYGQALVNTLVSLEHGLYKFDASVAGLGGCPYSPGATGNVATEDMVYFLESLGLKTGVDLEALAATGDWISQKLGKPNGSSVGRAILAKKAKQT